MEITFNKGIAGTYLAEMGIAENPRFGRNWFLWLPHIRHNEGRFWKKEVFDFSFSWLCFWVGFTIYPKWQNEGQADSGQLSSNK